MRTFVTTSAWAEPLLLAFMLVIAAFPASAQKDAPPKDVAPAATAQQPQTLDRVDAIINNQVVLESDVEEEMAFAAFEPFNTEGSGDGRKRSMQRLIDRDLLLQQVKLQPHPPVISDADLDKQLTELRRSLPACAKYKCTTDEGWKEFCAAHGFTPQQVRERWRQRMVLLSFIEGRFRTGIRISEPEIQSYYDKDFVPAFKEKNANPPSLDRVRDRISEILLQQRVTSLLNEWLTSLREEGGLQILDPRDIPPAEAAVTDSTSVSPGAIASQPIATPQAVPAPKKPDIVPAVPTTGDSGVPASTAPLPPTINPGDKH